MIIFWIRLLCGLPLLVFRPFLATAHTAAATTVVTMTAVPFHHKNMHQRAKQQNQERQESQNVISMVPEQKDQTGHADNNKNLLSALNAIHKPSYFLTRLELCIQT